MRNPFKKRTSASNPDTDPIYVTHAEDPSLAEDEMIMHTFIEPDSIKKEEQ